MTFSRDAVAALILALALDPIQALRLSRSTQKLGPDFIHTEFVSKYGIMYSTDVFPQHPSSDTKNVSPNDFTSITLKRWTGDDAISKHVAVWRGSNLSAEKKTEVSVAHDLLEHSMKHGTTTIQHSMYINAINTKKDTNPTVYVISSALPAFIASVMPRVNRSFVLVTGDAILRTPSQLFKKDEDMQRFIENPLILHWFAQNGHLEHPKFTRIPNGLDYHTLALKTHPYWGPKMSPQQQDNMLRQIGDSATGFSHRSSKVLVGFTESSASRKAVARHFTKSQISYTPRRGNREHYWKEIASTKYVASPPGFGWDCHRTWEALALGSIPIVESSGIDKLFLDNELPVSIITDWAEVEYIKVPQLANKFGERNQSVLPAMKLQYWVDKIKSKTSS